MRHKSTKIATDIKLIKIPDIQWKVKSRVGYRGHCLAQGCLSQGYIRPYLWKDSGQRFLNKGVCVGMHKRQCAWLSYSKRKHDCHIQRSSYKSRILEDHKMEFSPDVISYQETGLWAFSCRKSLALVAPTRLSTT